MGLFRSLRWFMGWLEERPSWRAYFLIIGGILACSAILAVAQYFVVLWLNIPGPEMTPEFEKFIKEILQASAAERGLILLFTAGLEEFAFRLLPLFSAMFLFGWFRVTKPLIIVVLVVSAIAFGLIHLENFKFEEFGYLGVSGLVLLVLLNQGVSGFLYGSLFLKYCGLTHFKYSWGAFTTLVLMHNAWNMGALTIGKLIS